MSDQLGYGGYGGQQPGGYPGAHSSGYYGHGPPNPNAGIPGGVSPEVQQWFNAVDRDRSGKITAKELQAALVNGQGKNFSDQACNLMIGMFDMDKSGMFDADKTGTIDINEFQQLYNYINQWLGTFRSYDRDQSGHIEENELAQAFQQMGFRFSPEFIKFLTSKSDLQNHAKISVDQFIVLCVQIQKFTDNESDLEYLPSESSCGRSFARKRKLNGDESITMHPENGFLSSEKNPSDRRLGLQAAQNNNKITERNEKLIEDMNQLVNENVHLLKENKQLHDDNGRLKERLRFLCDENERLRKEHKEALELSSWLNAAREIVETLKKQPVISAKPPKKLSPMVHTMDAQSSPFRPAILHSNPVRNHTDSRNSHWSDGEMPYSNGTPPTPLIKVERADEDQQLEEGHESPYHTPLLNFDQVEFHSSSKEGCDITNCAVPDIGAEPLNNELDKVGRKQLLFPEPVEGVCELCTGSRIYVALTAMDNISSKKSHSSVARSCLEAIFKMPYLLSCSVQGNVAKGPYGKPDVQRPSLYRPAVECILRFARCHAERYGWKVEENTTIKKQMNTRLSELRNIAKYKAQAQAASGDAGDTDHKQYSRYKNIVAALSALPIVTQPTQQGLESEARNACIEGDSCEPN